MSFLLDVAILGCGWAHVLLAPFTKVEESFNLHATHDILLYGVGPSTLANYDHTINPGPVRRTFLGSLLLAWISTPCIQLVNSLGYMSSKFDLQIMIRLVLATLNAFSLCLIRRAVSRRFGRPTSLFFAALCISQFHVPFYMGRTIPNMFALFPVNIATYYFLDRGQNTRYPSSSSTLRAISIFVFVAVVFRAEITLFLAPFALQALIIRQIGFRELLRTCIVSGLAAIATTVTVDSLFWQRGLLWPEFDNIYFNIVQGKSSEWGTSPTVTYVKEFLPSLLLSAYPLSAVGFLLDKRIRIILFPCFVFIGLISALGHKEWRFIVYVVPMFNVGAARALRWMSGLRKGSFFGRIAYLSAIGCLVANLCVTILMTRASMINYPGGEALLFTNNLLSVLQNDYDAAAPHIHISNLAAQTGASLFLHLNSPPFPDPSLVLPPTPLLPITPWTYNKTEHISLEELTSSSHFTHLIAETSYIQEATNSNKRLRSTLEMEWEEAGVISGFTGLQVNSDLADFIRSILRNEGELEKEAIFQKLGSTLRNLPDSVFTMKQEPRLALLQRRQWRKGT